MSGTDVFGPRAASLAQRCRELGALTPLTWHGMWTEAAHVTLLTFWHVTSPGSVLGDGQRHQLMPLLLQPEPTCRACHLQSSFVA